MSHLLKNYKELITRVDALCSAIAATLGGQITCSAGCSSCCTSITIFPVEAAALRNALENLPDQQAEEIRRHLSAYTNKEHCPLLYHQRCLLYEARPIICRTHGLPIVYSENGQRKGDCCPRNLIGSKSVSGTNVVDLDKLNKLLVAVNLIYISQRKTAISDERVTIATALAER